MGMTSVTGYDKISYYHYYYYHKFCYSIITIFQIILMIIISYLCLRISNTSVDEISPARIPGLLCNS
jgi:hypothetical protein